MGRNFHINLADLPWPVNILKFNQVVKKLQTGDRVTAWLSDGDIVGNLQQLIGSQADLRFEVSQSKRDYRIRVIKK